MPPDAPSSSSCQGPDHDAGCPGPNAASRPLEPPPNTAGGVPVSQPSKVNSPGPANVPEGPESPTKPSQSGRPNLPGCSGSNNGSCPSGTPDGQGPPATANCPSNAPGCSNANGPSNDTGNSSQAAPNSGPKQPGNGPAEPAAYEGPGSPAPTSNAGQPSGPPPNFTASTILTISLPSDQPESSSPGPSPPSRSKASPTPSGEVGDEAPCNGNQDGGSSPDASSLSDSANSPGNQPTATTLWPLPGQTSNKGTPPAPPVTVAPASTEAPSTTYIRAQSPASGTLSPSGNGPASAVVLTVVAPVHEDSTHTTVLTLWQKKPSGTGAPELSTDPQAYSRMMDAGIKLEDAVHADAITEPAATIGFASSPSFMDSENTGAVAGLMGGSTSTAVPPRVATWACLVVMVVMALWT